MRLRNVKGSKEKIQESTFVVKNPKSKKGLWSTLFENKNPIHIEIGMGKGKFILEQAKTHPDINYIGIEKYSSVLIRALDKREEWDGSNLLFLEFDAAYIEEIFEEGEVDRVYLNFSDPWPKDRHAKRRLTSKEFLGRYSHILNPEGQVIFKTDNRNLFEFSLEQVREAGWILKEVTYDLHHSEFVHGNIMTEYEERFMAGGNPIHRFCALRNSVTK